MYTILVILWGAWVRISHSGDGCGDTWPLCHGVLIPVAEQGKTWVEFAHRGMSGLFGFLVLGLFFASRKIFPVGHKVRFWAKLSLIFMITEALLGAKLVLFKLVGTNDSPYRTVVMALHFLNSIMLTGSIALTDDFSRGFKWVRRKASPWTFEGLRPQRIFTGCLISFILIGITGAIAALANTLFPSESLSTGFVADLAADSHYLVRLRGLHPFFGLLFGGSIALTAWLSVQLQKPEELEFKKRSLQLALICGTGVLFGMATLLSMAPIWMKLVHLALAHSIWILLVRWLRELSMQHEN